MHLSRRFMLLRIHCSYHVCRAVEPPPAPLQRREPWQSRKRRRRLQPSIPTRPRAAVRQPAAQAEQAAPPPASQPSVSPSPAPTRAPSKSRTLPITASTSWSTRNWSSPSLPPGWVRPGAPSRSSRWPRSGVRPARPRSRPSRRPGRSSSTRSATRATSPPPAPKSW